MTTVNASHLSAIPFIDMKSVDGRFLGTGTFFDGAKWRMWTPIPSGLIEIPIVDFGEGLYFAREPVSEHDLYFHFLDFIAQRAAYPEVSHGYLGIYDDVLNLTTVLAKVNLLQSSTKLVGNGISRMVTTEIEYLLSVCRSIFDLLQEVVTRLWGFVQLVDKKVATKPLKKSFGDMVTFRGEVTSLEVLQSRFGLPARLAEVYISFAEFFLDLRTIRDNLIHHGSPVQTIFADEDGFFVSEHLRPFSKMDVWREGERRPNNVLPLLPAVGAVIHTTLSACEAFSQALAASFVFPPPLVPGMHLFFRCPFGKRFSEAMADFADRMAAKGPTYKQP